MGAVTIDQPRHFSELAHDLRCSGQLKLMHNNIVHVTDCIAIRNFDHDFPYLRSLSEVRHRLSLSRVSIRDSRLVHFLVSSFLLCAMKR